MVLSAFWLRAAAAIVFLGPILYHSDRFPKRGLHPISEGLEVPLAYITVAAPLAICIIFLHLLARMIIDGGLTSAAKRGDKEEEVKLVLKEAFNQKKFLVDIRILE